MSVFGLVLILAISCVLIVVDLSLPHVAFAFQHRRTRESFKQQSWAQDGMLQLQRLAYQQRSEGVWEDCESVVPVTQKGDLLSNLWASQNSRTAAASGPVSHKHESKASVEGADPRKDLADGANETFMVTSEQEAPAQGSMTCAVSPASNDSPKPQGQNAALAGEIATTERVEEGTQSADQSGGGSMQAVQGDEEAGEGISRVIDEEQNPTKV